MSKFLITRHFGNPFPHFREKSEIFLLQSFVARFSFAMDLLLATAELPISIAVYFPVAEFFVDDHNLKDVWGSQR